MTWALAEVGRPGPAGDVLDGGDGDPTTGRLLSVGELQAALRAAHRSCPPAASTGSTRSTGTTGATAGRTGAAGPGPERSRLAERPILAASLPVRPLPARAGRAVLAPAALPGVLRPPPTRRWIAVVGAHGGAGTSTVALALADAAAASGYPVHLVSCNAPTECGLLGAASVELGVDRGGGWRTGRRGAGITLDRPVAAPDHATRWPIGPAGVDDSDLLTVVDAEAGAARAPRVLATAAAVLLVYRVSVRGVQQTEQLLAALLQAARDPAGGDRRPVVLAAALGPDRWSGRWPGPVRSATGPLLRQLQTDKQLVAVPLHRHLASYGPTGSALPRAVTRAGALAMRLLDSTHALATPPPTDGPPATQRQTSAPPAPHALLQKDTDRC